MRGQDIDCKLVRYEIGKRVYRPQQHRCRTFLFNTKHRNCSLCVKTLRAQLDIECSERCCSLFYGHRVFYGHRLIDGFAILALHLSGRFLYRIKQRRPGNDFECPFLDVC